MSSSRLSLEHVIRVNAGSDDGNSLNQNSFHACLCQALVALKTLLEKTSAQY